jgi:hypothetical protein
MGFEMRRAAVVTAAVSPGPIPYVGRRGRFLNLRLSFQARARMATRACTKLNA